MIIFKERKKLEFFLIFLSGLMKKKVCKYCFFLPGLMPVNFCREKFEKSKKKDYYLLEKSDGVRFIFLIGLSESYIINRKLFIQKIPRKNINFTEETKKGTIFDGEMSFNLIKEEYEYLIHDIASFQGDWRISTWDLEGRINILQKILKKDLKKKYFKKKDFFDQNNIENLFHKIHKNLFLNDCVYLNYFKKKNLICNKNDGIIFTASKKPYSTRFPNLIFKWKYENGNSIDFIGKNYKEKITIFENLNFKKNLYCVNYGNIRILIKTIKSNFFFEKFCCFSTKKNSEEIEEFIFEKKKGKWIYIKKRTDKKRPNSVKVLIKTLENIAETFLKKELVDKIFKQNLRKIRGKIFF
ncbi:mRNA capping enzyme (nucleomorph) [Chroomonas mesostigmatica CCMP1168]|uniref:mRNA guanylyltransferase n=1 Tax=Chroomonas mesostigmatica CCMP1168 TaxID=1195612 RepID=J7GB24_9CRYP|nr:mRNA capping enzyme [Chroomonas mesostigmatica CCMP1168]